MTKTKKKEKKKMGLFLKTVLWTKGLAITAIGLTAGIKYLIKALNNLYVAHPILTSIITLFTANIVLIPTIYAGIHQITYDGDDSLMIVSIIGGLIEICLVVWVIYEIIGY